MSETIKKEHGHFRRNWPFYTLLVLTILGVAALYAYGTITMKKQAWAFEKEKSALIEKAQNDFKRSEESNLELMMKTFVWAVRSEMTRGNQEQVDQYFAQLVKSEKVEEIILVDVDGTILLGTNKKKIGNTLEASYADAVMNVETTTIVDEVSKKIVAAPLLSLDSRIGTLMVIYNADVFELN